MCILIYIYYFKSSQIYWLFALTKTWQALIKLQHHFFPSALTVVTISRYQKSVNALIFLMFIISTFFFSFQTMGLSLSNKYLGCRWLLFFFFLFLAPFLSPVWIVFLYFIFSLSIIMTDALPDDQSPSSPSSRWPGANYGNRTLGVCPAAPFTRLHPPFWTSAALLLAASLTRPSRQSTLTGLVGHVQIAPSHLNSCRDDNRDRNRKCDMNGSRKARVEAALLWF